MKKVKALVLFSGGLDSMLAAKVLQLQGILVDGICFESNFYTCEKAKKAAKELGIKLIISDISKEALELVKNPLSGYGKHLNPCIDCHALMVKKASEYFKKYVAEETGSFARKRAQDDRCHIIASGEVLGQRPFSQTKDALKRVEKLAGVEVLRPLSAKKLEETKYEKEGLVNRGRLLNISGRSRERQIELAERYNLKGYATPAGGCLLTDPEFSDRLGKMLDYWPECTPKDAELLKHGRIFWLKLSNNTKILLVIGRHQQDNEHLEKLAKNSDIMVQLKEIKGPLTIVRISNFQFLISNQNQKSKIKIKNFNLDIPEKLRMSDLRLGEEKNEEEILNIAGLLTGYYATKARGKTVKLEFRI